MPEKKYWVDGTGIADHGDEHAADGFCEATRKAEVKGTFEGIDLSQLLLH